MRSSCLVLATLLGACASASRPSANPEPHAQSSAVVEIAPPIAPSAPPAIAAPPRPIYPASPFHLALTNRAALQIFPMRAGTAIVADVAPLAICARGEACVDAGAVGAGPATIGCTLDVVGLAGRWPDAAWMARFLRGGEEGQPILSHWQSGRWIDARKTDGPWSLEFRQLHALDDDHVVGLASLRADGMSPTFMKHAFETPPGDRLVLLAGSPRSMPRFDRSGLIYDFTALGSKSIAVLGEQVKESRYTQTFVRRYGGAGTGAIELLPPTDACASRDPGVEVGDPKIESDGKNGAYVAGSCGSTRSAYLAKFDGHTWNALPTPPTMTAIESIAVPTATSLWITTQDGTLWKRASDGAEWSVVPLPAIGDGTPCKATSVWGRDGDDMFVTARCDASDRAMDFALFRTREGAELHVGPHPIERDAMPVLRPGY